MIEAQLAEVAKEIKGIDSLKSEAKNFYENLSKNDKVNLDNPLSNEIEQSENIQKNTSDLSKGMLLNKTENNQELGIQNFPQGKRDYNSNIKVIDGVKCRVDDNGKPYAKYNSETGEYDLIHKNTYSLNGYEYKTDDKGRIKSAEGDLHKTDRNNKKTINENIKGIEDGDDKGHIIADTFDGQNDLGNLVPMDGNLNKGDYKSMELQLKKALENGSDVHVKVQPRYSGDSSRPDSFKVTYSIDGVETTKIFKNVPNGGTK